MPINSFLYPGAKVTPAYEVANSCRFNDGDSAYMHKTPGSSGNQRKFTFSTWFKLGNSTEWLTLFATGADASNRFVILRHNESSNNSQIKIDAKTSDSQTIELRTDASFRDPTAWMHLVVAVDTEQSTSTNRVKVYINGTQITSFNQTTYPAEDHDTEVNKAAEHRVGRYNAGDNYFDGYLAETVFIDGTQYAASDFGEFDEDSPTIWKPKDVSGLTFGTNGFYLDFEDSANLGNDANGGTDLTEVNLAATDQMTDTPTLNYAVMNPLDNYYAGSTFSEGNLKIVTVASGSAYMVGTIGVSSGKWYWEVKAVSFTTGADYCAIGVSSTQITGTSQLGANSNDYGFGNTGTQNSGGSSSSYGSSYANNDIIGVYLDLDNNKLYFSINGTLQNSGTGISITAAASTSLGAYFPAISDWSSSGSNLVTAEFNFGGGCPFSISSGNTDGEYGNFEYSTTITGDGSSKTFKALNSANLAEYG